MPTAQPIPFVGPPNQRSTSATDQRYVNVLFERIPNEVTQEQLVYCVKRPGLLNHSQPPAGAAAGRGIYAWGATGKIYSVFANKVYSNTSDLGVTLAGSTNKVWFAETPASSGTQLLVLSDGSDNYNITTSDGITKIDQFDDVDYPTANLGPIVFMDGYLFQAQSNGKLWNTDLNDYTSWSASGFLSVDTHGGALEAIHVQKDQIIAFTKNRIEFFFNNGNPIGSPLLRIDQNTTLVGLASKYSLAWSGETIIFVAENASGGDGGRSVMMISPGKGRTISTPPINRLLDSEVDNIANITSWMERVSGQLIYVMNIPGIARSTTYVYSVETGLWSEWQATDNAKFYGISATSLNGVIYVQDVNNGRIYILSNSTFQDSGTTFPVTLQTNRSNFGSPYKKIENELSIVGDTTTGSLAVSVSDNDYGTFNTARNIDMSSERKRITRLGSFYNRAHKFTYTENAAFRVQAFVPNIDVGHS